MNTATSFDLLALLMVVALIAAGLLWSNARAWTALCGSALVFVLVASLLPLMPGDATRALLGDDATPEARTTLEVRFGLREANGTQRPAPAVVGRFVRDVACSIVLTALPQRTAAPCHELLAFRDQQPVRLRLIKPYLTTVTLALLTFTFAWALAFALAALSLRRGVVGNVAQLAIVCCAAVPRVLLGPLLLIAFAVTFAIFPVHADGAGLRGLVLPAGSLALLPAAAAARLLQTALHNSAQHPAMLRATATGVSPCRRQVLHRGPLLLLDVLPLMSLHAAGLLTGAVITERVFGVRGMGALLVDAVRAFDVPVVLGCIACTATSTAFVLAVVDAARATLDPRRQHA